MAGSERAAKWIAEKLVEDGEYAVVRHIGSCFLEIEKEGQAQFLAAALGEKDIVELAHVSPVFEIAGRKPEFVVNVPSKAIWTGEVIDFIHSRPAAFGSLGDLKRAAEEVSVPEYRSREYSYFERMFRQHDAVVNVTRIYDRVFLLHRRPGMKDMTVALVDGYEMSAEHVRHARDLYGSFDIALKTSPYGTVTSAAIAAAETFGAQALIVREFLKRLHSP